MPAAMTQELVKELLEYNPESGEFIWKKRDKRHFKTANSHASWNAKFAGCAAGSSPNSDGYITIGILYKRYKTHRLAYLYMEGRFPEETDHINHDRTDNRWINLREVTRKGNQRNRLKTLNNTSGFIGVHKHGKKWVAQVGTVEHKRYLGTYNTPEEANAVAIAFRHKQGFHENHGLSPSQIQSH